MHCLSVLKDLRLLADKIQQTQRGAGRLPTPSFPADGSHFRDVEQPGKHRLADVELLAGAP